MILSLLDLENTCKYMIEEGWCVLLSKTQFDQTKGEFQTDSL